MGTKRPPRPAGRGTHPLDIDTTVPQPARVQSYLAGGDAHFAVDRELGDYLQTASPTPDGADPDLDLGPGGVRAHLAFTARVVRYLVAEAGVRQLLSFGATVPMLDHVHPVAQQAAPESRVVYVGRDPVVLAHAHSLRNSTSEGATAYVCGGLRAPRRALQEAAEILDFTQPVAVLLIDVLNLVDDDDRPYEIVAELMEAVPSGSYLAVAHPSGDFRPDESARIAERISDELRRPFVLRTGAEILRFVEGLELEENGLVHINEWRRPTDVPFPPGPNLVSTYGAVARKP